MPTEAAVMVRVPVVGVVTVVSLMLNGEPAASVPPGRYSHMP